MANATTIAKHPGVSARRAPKTTGKTVAKGSNIKSKASAQADKIILSLDEVGQIESGKKKGKSFDQFLEEL